MNPQHFIEAFALGKKAIELASSAVGLIGDNTKREAAKEMLEQSRKAFALAEIKAAEDLEYPLCQCDFPPGICTLDSTNNYVCRKCGRYFAMHKGKAGGGL
jgi:hypothetical protein